MISGLSRKRSPLVFTLPVAVLVATGCAHLPSRLPDGLGAACPARASRLEPVGGTNEELDGLADFHSHMYSHLSFGGYLFWGEPEGELANALRPCQHTRAPHFVTAGVVQSVEPKHGPDGWNPSGESFQRWPRYYSRLHQQMHVEWVHRAYLHGLRLLVVLATDNRTLCEASHRRFDCDEMNSVQRQIEAIRCLASRESQWLGIAETPGEARELIRQNKLAIVMGIEVDTLFNCAQRNGDCTKADIVTQLEKYGDLGVRQITPLHFADNAFGHAAVYDERFAANQHYLRGTYHTLAPCERGEPWSNRDIAVQIQGGGALPTVFKFLTFALRLRWYSPPISDNLLAAAGHCNQGGLTDLGKELIRQLMRRGMLIDLDHMSEETARAALEIAEKTQYPMMLSHARIRELKLGPGKPDSISQRKGKTLATWYMAQRRAEMHRSAAMLERIAALSGVVGLIPNQGYIQLPPGVTTGVPNDCDTSAKSFAQALLYAEERMHGRGIGLGTDFNGLAGQPGPRFGPHACGMGPEGVSTDRTTGTADARTQNQQAQLQESEGLHVAYGQVKVGGRTLEHHDLNGLVFDIDRHGLAHYGMVPDFVAELSTIGVPDRTIDLLYSSARDYIRMWEIAEAKGR